MNMGMIKAALLSRSALPPQYQRVEWIKPAGTGGQTFINTRVGSQKRPSQISINAKFVVEDFIGWTQDARPFGARFNNLYLSYIQPDKSIGIDMGKDERDVIRNLPASNTTIIFDLNWSDPKISINGDITHLGKGTDELCGQNLLIFQWNNGGATDMANDSRKLRCYYFKIYENSVAVRNMIPCRRKSDNKPGMWDTVSKTFFTNAGTGNDFVLGPDVI